MDEPPLVWKVVFKDILGVKKKTKDDTTSFSEQYQNKSSSQLLHSKTNEKRGTCSADTLQLKHSFTSGPYEKELFKTKARQSKTDTTNFIPSAIKQKYDVNICKDKAPEWNTVFKDILGESATINNQDRKNSNVQPKFKSASIKKDTSFRDSRKKHYPKKSHYISSTYELTEELKIRKFFASSRVLLKPEISSQSLNDYAGTGVDIFKFDKKLTFTLSEREAEPKNDYPTEYKKQRDFKKVPSKTHKRVHFEECTTQEYMKDEFPSGLIAKMKTLTSADILATPAVPFNEPAWDDDLFF